MKTLFCAADKDEVLARIAKLTPESRPLWGKMDVAQMMAHVQVGLRFAMGDMELRRVWMGVLFGGMAKRLVMSGKPIPRNLPTGPEFIVADRREFARERDALIALIERFAAAGEPGLTRAPHPFFGRLTSTEWQVLMWRHLDHHLSQFSAN